MLAVKRAAAVVELLPRVRLVVEGRAVAVLMSRFPLVMVVLP